MFERIKRSMMIEKGYLLWQQELEMDLKNLISKFPFAQAASYREGLREMQEKMGLEQHDVAIMMIVPFLDAFDFATQGDVHKVIKRWNREGLIQPDVLDFYKSKITHPLLKSSAI